PVRTSPSPGKGRGFLALAAAYGQSSPASLARYDPATSSLRTCQRSLLGDSAECLQTLPRWGWMRGGAVSGLMASGGPTIGKGAGSWLPTPRNNTGPSTDAKHLSLDGYIQMWPTPTSNDGKNAGYQVMNGRLYPTLPGAVGAAALPEDREKGQGMWP